MKQLETINFGPLVEYVTDCVDGMSRGCERPKDFDHYVFEYVLEGIYGKNCWKEFNRLPGNR